MRLVSHVMAPRAPRGAAPVAALAVALLAGYATPPPPPPEVVEEVAPLPAPPPMDAPRLRIEAIVVRKAERTLVATCAGGAELRLPVALSREPGPKQVRGDLRMPEGEYRIAGPARESRFHRFLPIDYPAPADAARGLAEGRISQAEHDAILAAHRAGRMPPQDTALGGWLGLHGEGRRWRGHGELDWTEGCVALADPDIERLAPLAPPGTPVRIEP